MTATKPTLAQIIELDNITIWQAEPGRKFVEYPNGNPIKMQNAKVVLLAGGRYYAAANLDTAIITAFRNGGIDLLKHGYDTCHRCNGTGKLSHYGHVNSGTCFKCNGYGVL